MSLDQDRARLLELLVRHAYARRRVILASGRESDFYIDCRGVALSAEGHALIGRLLFRLAVALDPGVEAVGGMSLGADPLASAVSLTSWIEGRPLGAFLVRKEPKDHGTARYVEGLELLPANARAVVVEDVITSGGSSWKAVERARAAGLLVGSVAALVDRQEGGRERLETEGLKVASLFTRDDFP